VGGLHPPGRPCLLNRGSRGTHILPGDANLILDPASTTLPGFLRAAGYATGCVGKWHLGLGRGGKVDWNGAIQPGPLEVGFDSSFIIPATGDRVPTVFVEGHRVVGFDPNDPLAVSYGLKVGDEPTGRDRPELLTVKPSSGHDGTIVNGISRIGYQSGGKAAWWKDEGIADTLTKRATAFIERSRDRPFFLYFATHDIHVPRVPYPRFAGTSRCGVRGDVIQQLDGSVGEVLAALQRLGLADDTLVIFSSDNGPVVDDGYADGSAQNLNGHAPAGSFRGGKYTIYEGGTRMPFLVRWPGKVKPGVSGALVCQVDFLASFASLLGKDLPADAGPDSQSVLPALLGESSAGRDYLVEQSGGLALRQGPWKFIPRADGAAAAGQKPDDGHGAAGQLYNLADDPGETTDLAGQHPEVVRDLAALLQRLRQEGRSRPEAPAKP
jgi:arylsulfatase A-like enzyme